MPPLNAQRRIASQAAQTHSRLTQQKNEAMPTRTVHRRSGARAPLILAMLAGLLSSRAAFGISYDLPIGDDSARMVLNTTVTLGGGIRTQSPSVNIVGKSNLDPNVCGVPYQNCQGVFKDQVFPAQQLARSPGAASVNGDDGDLNYSKGSFFQGVAKLTPDLTLSWHDFGLFARALYFYDVVNDDFTETHPNRITAQNRNDANVGIDVATPLFLPYPGGKVYGRGAPVYSKRTDGEVLNQVGTNLQYLDSYVYGKLPLWGERQLTFKLGRQVVNWGESTTLVINSINQANPVNQNNFQRIGAQTEEVFTPINMAFLSFEPIDNTTLEGFYQLEWQPVEISTPGSYFSTVDVGSRNAVNTVAVSFGAGAEDPDSVARLQYNPLALLTNTTLTAQRLADVEPRTSGQYGVKLDYYADWLNDGTTLAGYYMHYHSRLPYASFYAANPSCARAAGNSRGNDATNLVNFLIDCPQIPLTTNNPDTATSSVAALDSVKLQLQYPENIDLIGVSFNTTVGEYSIQGEVAYRPNLPLQIDQQDLVFAAFGPTLTNCADPNTGCLGSAAGGVGFNEANERVRYGSSDYTTATGAAGAYRDTFNVGEGALPGSARAYPNYVVPYRGGVAGQNPGCAATMTTADYRPGIPCWIRGWERMQVYQFNFGSTRVLGATDNWLGADQVLMVTELGATYVPGLPALDQLQFEADGTNYAASAGADGSGFVRSGGGWAAAGSLRQACSTTVDCSYGPDGLRFNPHQQDPTGYPDKLSWGYRLIGIIKYENVFPGIGVQPTITYAQDVQGTAPGPGGNFIAGRKQANVLIETRYKSSLSLNLGYSWFWGGGAYNLLSDRDFAQFFVKYQF